MAIVKAVGPCTVTYNGKTLEGVVNASLDHVYSEPKTEVEAVEQMLDHKYLLSLYSHEWTLELKGTLS